MNTLFKIFLFTFLCLGLLHSAKAKISFSSELSHNPKSGLIPDSLISGIQVTKDSVTLNIFPPSSGVQFYKDGIVFLSHTKKERKMVPKHLSFGTLEAYYLIPWDTIPVKPEVFSPSSNFAYPCDALTFNDDFTRMFYTKKSKKDGKEKIYAAGSVKTKKKYQWIFEDSPLNFCETNFRYTHPALSKDGETMVFASDMTGSVGGMDLFITHKEPDGWSVPKNLGSTINTAGNELFPHLDSENNLFFSSNGLPGYGGYDIFFGKFNGVQWDQLINLSAYINSQNDDVAFTLNRIDGKKGFFTTRTESQIPVMQLYGLELVGDEEDMDSIILSDVLFNLALLENDFPLLVINDKINFTQVKDSLPAVTAELIDQDSIVSAPEEIEIKYTPAWEGTAIEETLVIIVPEEVIKIEPQVPLAAIEPGAEPPTVTIAGPEYMKDAVVYKVQFMSRVKPRGKFQITVNETTFNVNEYFYKNEYRYTIGEFSSLTPAVELQNACRRAGYPKAFVVAFKNGVRSLDPMLFKD